MLSGDAARVQTIPDNYLGPVISVTRGQHLRINFKNELSEDTTVHFHGITIPSHMAGHPHAGDVVHPGGTFVYEFDIVDRAGLYFFHPHPHAPGRVPGLPRAGRPAVGDGRGGRGRWACRTGRRTCPSSSRTGPSTRTTSWSTPATGWGAASMGGMMSMMQGFMGDRMLVNGRPDYVLTLPPGPCPPAPAQRVQCANLQARLGEQRALRGHRDRRRAAGGAACSGRTSCWGPASALDLWVDFSGQPAGAELVLQGLPFTAA